MSGTHAVRAALVSGAGVPTPKNNGVGDGLVPSRRALRARNRPKPKASGAGDRKGRAGDRKGRAGDRKGRAGDRKGRAGDHKGRPYGAVP